MKKVQYKIEVLNRSTLEPPRMLKLHMIKNSHDPISNGWVNNVCVVAFDFIGKFLMKSKVNRWFLNIKFSGKSFNSMHHIWKCNLNENHVKCSNNRVDHLKLYVCMYMCTEIIVWNKFSTFDVNYKHMYSISNCQSKAYILCK